MTRIIWIAFVSLAFTCGLRGEPPIELPRCQIVPHADDQFAFLIDGVQRTRWHFGDQYPGPFFYPLVGPDGGLLTRMGHPGAPNHDHHRSVWIAHYKVAGHDFWSMAGEGKIRQQQWLCLQDGDDEAIMAVRLGWFDGQERELMQHELAAAIRPLPNECFSLEVQHRLQAAAGRETLQLQKTNFGIFAVRVAKTLSGHFGGGTLRDSEGRRGEAEIFGQTARWVDYSGPVAVGLGEERRLQQAGVTFFDHPSNPRHPTRWHVREDGWMGASLCFDDAIELNSEQPLTVRYLLYVHGGDYEPEDAAERYAEFADRPEIVISKAARPHTAFTATRGGE